MAVIGARVRVLREDLGLEIGQLAYKTGVSKAHLYRIEGDERPNVSAVVLERISVALDTSVDYLVGRTDNPAPPLSADAPYNADPELALRRRRLAERLSELPPGRQRRVMDAFMLLLESEEERDGVES